jgi:hypothetical protein
MAKRTSSKKHRVKRGGGANVTHTPRKINRRKLPDEIQAVNGVYDSRLKAEGALTELERTGFRQSDISVSHLPVATGREGEVLETAARIAGGAFALSSIAVAVPFAFALEALGVKTSSPASKAPVLVTVNVKRKQHAAKVAKQVLLKSGGSRISSSPQREDSDLKRREYRDEAGRLHHHTHTYMRDHRRDLRATAA